ncbi:N-acetylmuramoyl-L-alanine amidase [Aestuariibacter sp. AA17]|uniref:N-acetylmuramoyl-L-alanine amidase n=1 Tax=Fluctibacter corallii TaxID=2984329 RepID=A0ABT3A3Z0_9ALTE|nr:N-acetylmuramoyl-L-alanine amidase [Aestuariibacter sp. AA17]MCV2883318.1 N-acetylmuramoyl-L-alanine amidase [Aestuariibacter sp. AA17]
MISAHKLLDIPFHASPNVGGVMQASPSAVVIHYTGNESLSGTVNWLCDPQARASAHVVIGEQGELVQLVPFNHVAWHAGKSQFQGRSNFNRFSIGIELVNPGKLTRVGEQYCAWFGKAYPKSRVVRAKHQHASETGYWCAYTEAQITALTRLILLLKNHYPIQQIVGHDDISPGRKCDPGPAFPLNALRRQVLHIDRHTADHEDTCEQEKDGEVIASQLNIRDSINGKERRGPLQHGQKLVVLEEEAGWYKVQVQETGWVKKEFVSIRDPQPEKDMQWLA